MAFKGLKIADTAFLARSAPTVSPNDFSGLIRWYKADSFSLADGDDIGGTGREWIDQSPTAPNDATQATLADRPLYRTNIFGSMPAIHFSNKFMLTPGIVLSGDFTIISIAKAGSNTTLFGHTTLNLWVRLRVAFSRIDWHDLVGNPQSASFTTSFGVVNMSSWRRDGSGNITFRERNIDRTTVAATVISRTFDLMGGTTGFALSDGHVGELCVWNTRLSDANVDSLYTNYFKTRWGLS